MKLPGRSPFWAFLICAGSQPSYGQQMVLSPSSHISILTCGRSPDVYATFGHSAIRVSDPQNNIDICFNYGTFNFNDPDFYFKFLKGNLYYFLSVSDSTAF